MTLFDMLDMHCKILNKHFMIQCLLDISSNTGDDLDCEEWVNMVNRGRLWQKMKTCTVSFVGWKNLFN